MADTRGVLGAALVLLVLLGCGGGTRGTIGAVLGQRADGRVFVRDAPEGLGAEQAGLEAGDEIMLIDDIEARRLTAQQIHQLLSGPVGATVKLTVIRKGEVVRMTVTRTEAREYRLRGEARDGEGAGAGAGEGEGEREAPAKPEPERAPEPPPPI